MYIIFFSHGFLMAGVEDLEDTDAKHSTNLIYRVRWSKVHLNPFHLSLCWKLDAYFFTENSGTTDLWVHKIFTQALDSYEHLEETCWNAQKTCPHSDLKTGLTFKWGRLSESPKFGGLLLVLGNFYDS